MEAGALSGAFSRALILLDQSPTPMTALITSLKAQSSKLSPCWLGLQCMNLGDTIPLTAPTNQKTLKPLFHLYTFSFCLFWEWWVLFCFAGNIEKQIPNIQCYL